MSFRRCAVYRGLVLHCRRAFSDLVIDSIFGIEHTLYDGLHATPRLCEFDSAARLESIHYQGREFAASEKGIEKVG